MLINTIANAARTKNGELLTIEMLKAELAEIEQLKPKTAIGRRDKNQHLLSLKAMIQYKENRRV